MIEDVNNNKSMKETDKLAPPPISLSIAELGLAGVAHLFVRHFERRFGHVHCVVFFCPRGECNGGSQQLNCDWLIWQVPP